MPKFIKIFSTGKGFTKRGQKSAEKAVREKELRNELGQQECFKLRIRMDMQQLSRNASL